MLHDKAHLEVYVTDRDAVLKIDAIKALRAMSGFGLKESKDIIDKSYDTPQQFILTNVSDEALATGAAALKRAGITMITEGRYDEYKEQLKELICVATMKEDYYFASRLADFLDNF